LHKVIAMKTHSDKTRILFVCLGNICRSPSAEAIFREYANRNQLDVEVDSAGTSAWHQGEKADHRMRQSALKRGYNITSLSRPFVRSDFELFDLIVAMDDQNFHDLNDKALTSNVQWTGRTGSETYADRCVHKLIKLRYKGKITHDKAQKAAISIISRFLNIETE